MSCQMIKKGKIWEMMVMFDILANIRYPLLFIDVCVRRYRVHCGSATWSSGWHHRVKSKGATNDPTHHIHTYTPTADMNDSESEWIQSKYNNIIVNQTLTYLAFHKFHEGKYTRAQLYEQSTFYLWKTTNTQISMKHLIWPLACSEHWWKLTCDINKWCWLSNSNMC